MKNSFFTFFFLLLSMYAHAQQKPLLTIDDVMQKEYHILYGQVLDHVTRQPLVGVKTQLLTKDSILVFEWTIIPNAEVANLRSVFVAPLPEAGA